MFRAVGFVALTFALLSGGALVPSAHAYTPRQSVMWNNPASNDDAAVFRSMTHLRKSIQSAPPQSIIRLATYSYDRGGLTTALVNACKRGVTVQMVLNDNWTSAATRRLQKYVGTDIDPHWNDACNPRTKPEPEPEPEPDPGAPAPKAAADDQPYPEPSFVKICRSACRGPGGNQHMKFFLFSKTGKARDVVMIGSTNPTGYAAKVHWNDLFTTTGKHRMFLDYSRVFRELAEDRAAASRWLVFQHGGFVTEFGPHPQARKRAQDPIMKRLGQVRCKAGAGTGIKGRTAVRIMMYAWVGDRGLALARKVAGLRRSGCNVSAILSQPSKGVRKTLKQAGVKLRTADLDLDNNKETGFNTTPWERFTHEKWMTVNGHWAGSSRRLTWTGSENWSDKSLSNDEVTIRIPSAKIHNAYIKHFTFVWNRHSRPL